MDLGCLDMGCVEVSAKKLNSESALDTESKESDTGSESVTATSKIRKNKNSKENTQTTLNSINKSASQIKKPSHRKNSPVNWFPRKKVDSFLKRKIKMLQEVAGMNLTLDETLGDSNPHYSKVLKEKMAAREAANKAIEARKVALVEASWCRILKAARIQRIEAEEELAKAEAVAAEAFKAALAIGVNMYDIPNCPQKPHQVESSSSSSSSHSREGSTIHGVTASFENAFDVDKEVASSVKTALIKLANGSSFNKDEFRDLLRKISENPDTDENGEERSDDSSPKREQKLSGSEIEATVTLESGSKMRSQSRMRRTRRSGNKRRKSLEKLNATVRLVDKMFERLERLKEEELSSLTTIVATCGLSAALAEIESNKLNNTDQNSRRMSSRGSTGKVEILIGRHVRKNQTEPKLPSLDKCLVKHVTRLEREVQDAKNARKESKEEALENPLLNISGNTETALVDEAKKSSAGDFKTGCEVSDLGSVLVNKHSSKLEKEIEEAKKNFNRETKAAHRLVDEVKKSSAGDCKAGSKIPDLGSVLVNKHSSKLEKEIEEAKKNFNRETQAANRTVRHAKEDTSELPGLDKVLVKRMTRLEKEVQEAKDRRQNEELGARTVNLKGKENKGHPNTKQSGDSLESVLVKPVHRFEREKTQAFESEYGYVKPQNKPGIVSAECESLDKVLMVKPKSRLERGGNMVAWEEEKEEAKEDQVKVSAVARREARERELQEAWGGFGLGNSLKPHLSRLERDKAAWIKADEEERKQSMVFSD